MPIPLDVLKGVPQAAQQPNGQPVHGEQTTHDDPQQQKPEDQLSREDQQALIALVREYKQSWWLRRRLIVKRVQEAYEFFKGNHFISFDPESQQFFDAIDQYMQQNSGVENEDLDLYKFVTNFYQMFGFAFIAALSSQVPKTRFLPENAENEQDIATAKAASRVQAIIERQNKIKSLHKRGLLLLWMSGCYFRHTRYLIDGDRAGYHKEPTIEMKVQELIPERFLCPNCGSTVPEQKAMAMGGLRCPKCKTPLSGNDFYPAEYGEVPMQTGAEDVANGMVAMTLYSPLYVDAAPYARTLKETPILNVDQEVDIASLRESYPAQWDALNSTIGPMNSENQQDRVARMAATSEVGARSNFIQDLQPTLSRTWIQPWAFNKCKDKETAKKLKGMFPKGCLLVNVGDLFLEARKSRLEDEWTWCGTVDEEFGLFPFGAGDAAIPVQKRINDVANIVHEYMDRLVLGMLLYNMNLVDGEALNGKAMNAGVLNGIKMKQIASAQGNSLESAFFHLKAAPDPEIYGYQEKLVFTAQMLVGTPPQIYGGSGDPHIETASGQKQQLTTATIKLGQLWDNVREEHAQAAEIAVECGARNMTDDLISVITDESGKYRNDYVRLDEMQGNVHCEAEADNGFPMSYDEIKAFWEKLIQFGASGKNPYVNAVLDEPSNQEQMATYTGVPGLVAPGRDMRNKVLRVIDMLMKVGPDQVPAVDPQTGQPIPPGPSGEQQMMDMPTIKPDREIDDLDVIVKTIKAWGQRNFEKKDDPQTADGWRNVIAHFKLAQKWLGDKAQKAASAQAPPKQLTEGGDGN